MDGAGTNSDRPDDETPRDPLEEMLASMLGPETASQALSAMRAQGIEPGALAGMPQDPVQLQAILGQVQRMMASSGDGPVNWEIAGDVARQTAVQSGDQPVSLAQANAVRDALRVADLWLDAATELAPAALTPQAWTKSEWTKHTLPTWQTLAEPVASSVVEAMFRAAAAQAEQLPPEMRGMLDGGMAQTMMKQLGSAMFGMQLGQAVGTLAGETFGSTDIGLPLHDEPIYALLPHTIDAYAAELDVPREEVRQFLAVREAARARLFHAVPWLRSHLLGAVEAYAREIDIDVAAIEDAMRDLDPTSPEQMPELLREKFSHGGLFGQEPSSAQTAALTRLETMLALVEGWVEEVGTRAVAPHLPHQVQLREMLRRRRATDGPAEQTFRTLVGLELRPHRVREAAALWASLGDQRGIEERDALWQHPDLMPSSEELDDPSGFVAHREQGAGAEQDVDAALAAIFDGTLPRSEGALARDAESRGATEGGAQAGAAEDQKGSAGPEGSEGSGGSGGSEGPGDDADGPEDAGPVDGRNA